MNTLETIEKLIETGDWTKISMEAAMTLMIASDDYGLLDVDTQEMQRIAA
jgi:hypothetical protein